MARYVNKDQSLKGLKRRRYSLPVEEHSTAAWANLAGHKDVSRVGLPSDLDVELAREWAEENQK
ncbi:MAG: DUF3787 domain-containing protein [Firmicutes bacterium]|nr:DUF3787 domain-containing protein [Bacillota bacterium]